MGVLVFFRTGFICNFYVILTLSLIAFYVNHPSLFQRQLSGNAIKERYMKGAEEEWGLVVGGSMGMGLAFANALASRKVNLILLARRESELAAAAESIRSRHNVQVEAVALDLRKFEELQTRLHELTRARNVSIVVYNAAHILMGHTVDYPFDFLASSVNVNVNSLLVSVTELLYPMLNRRRGAFIMLSSVSGEGGSYYGGLYSATKAFTTVLGESLWVEAKDLGVDVLVCAPALTKTPNMEAMILREQRNSLIENDPNDVAEECLSALGRGPVCYPLVLSKFVAFLQWIIPTPWRLTGSRNSVGLYVPKEKLMELAMA